MEILEREDADDLFNSGRWRLPNPNLRGTLAYGDDVILLEERRMMKAPMAIAYKNADLVPSGVLCSHLLGKVWPLR